MSKHALIVDSNPAQFAVYEPLLAELDVPVRWERDGQRALDHLRRQSNVRLIVTELSLARLDGFALLEQRKALPSAGVPVVVVSAFRAMRETAAEMRETLGINAVLATASPASTLRRVFQRALRRESVPAYAPQAPAPLSAETHRLASVDAAGIARRDPLTDQELQAVVERVARELGAPTSLLSIVLRDKQWFRARTGVGSAETPLEHAFCRHVVEARRPMVVPDALSHPTFASNGYVQDRSVRGYAGAPLIGSDGEAWGTLCIVDPDHPLRQPETDLRKLEEVARLVVAEVEGRAARPMRAELDATFCPGR